MTAPTHSPRLLRLAAILAVVLGATTVEAETYRVGPGRTYKNLQAVARILKPGDLVEVDGNVTYPGGVTFTRPGTAADPIVIRGLLVDGKRPVISGGTNTVHFRTDVIGSGADHYVMEGFEITGGSSRCVFHQSNELTLRDVVVHDCPSYGIKGADWGAGSLTVEHSEVFRCGAGDAEHQIDASTDQANYPDSVFRLQDSYLHDASGGNNIKSRAARNEIRSNRIEGAYYQELELTGSECCAEGTSDDATVRAAALTAAAAWTPPVGIPAPSFGIAQEVADTTYTHWVNNSGSCSDSGNGTPAAPRCTIPTSLAAGAVVQVRGGPYSITSDRTWSAAGSLASPVFVRGPAGPAARPIMRFGNDNRLTLSGTYLIVENLEMQSGAVNISSSSHHVAVRHFYLHDNPSGPGSFLGNSGDDVVIYDSEIAYNGVIPSDSDDHGIQTFSGTRNVWIVDNHIHHNSGDGIQFCHGCIGGGNGPSNVYIGRNRIHDDEENAIDIKESLGPVIVSENELYGYEPGTFSGNGDAIRLNDEGTQGQIWILNNRVHDSTICINPSGSTASSYILGNRLWNCTSTGISDSGDSTIVANNTVVNTGRGIVGGTEVRGNIVSQASNCHLCSDVSGCSNNLAWQTGGSADVDSSCTSTVLANPLMLMSGNEQTGLQAGSPAVNAGFAHSAYTYFQTTYGLDIRRDPAGTVRPTGSAWDIGAFEAGGGGGGSTLSINDVTVGEGNSGTTNAVLTVTLSPARTTTVTVNYATANGTATAGSDYVAQSGTLTFTAGQTSKTVAIVVNGDTSVEPNETFVVNLSAPVGATLADAQGQATITNDDAGALPTISINNVSVTEGNSGTTNAVLTVTLSQASATTVTVNYATANGTATAGSDYVAQSGTLTFTAGQTSKPVTVVVNGDTSVEPNETFLVNLSAPVGATIADSQGTGTINNDEGTGQLPQPVVWTSAVGATVSANSLTKTAATAWGNSGAVSTQQITSGDGFVEVTASETTTARMIGLSNGNSDNSYTDIDFAAYLAAGQLHVYEAGVSRGIFGNYSPGDMIRVAVVGPSVKYSKNGVVFYTSSRPIVYPLLVDSALYHQGATLNNAMVLAGGPPPPGSVPVVWTSAGGVTVSANSLTKAAATAWGNAGAVSSQQIAGDGYVQVTGTANTAYRMFGLSNGNSSYYYQEIDFALCLCGSELRVYEGGVLRGSFGSFATGNLLRVAVVGSTVTYSKNGVGFYTSTATPTRPLLLDAALYTTGATLGSAVIAGAAPASVPVVWTSPVGLTVSGNSLTKTAATAWGNSGAASSQQITGNGYVQVTGTANSTYRMFGLSNGNSSTHYQDIDYALCECASEIRVYEGGVLRGTFGNFATGNLLRVAVVGSTVTYSRNGVVFYTSTVAPTRPLLVDAALYTTGATLNSAVISITP